MIALGEGGVRESVREGVTGAFYDRDDAGGAGRGRARPSTRWRSIRRPAAAAAERFGVRALPDQLRRIVAEAVAAERPPRPGERPAVAAGLLPSARRRSALPPAERKRRNPGRIPQAV